MRPALASGAVLLTLGSLAGCTWVSSPIEPMCQPAPLALEPASVPAGGEIRLSAGPTDCDLGFEDGHTYKVSIGTRGETDPILLDAALPVAADGAFDATLTVPPNTPAGEWTITIVGAILECNDTVEIRTWPFALKPLASCAGYFIPITVTE